LLAPDEANSAPAMRKLGFRSMDGNCILVSLWGPSGDFYL
jgi:hypothetical protein